MASIQGIYVALFGRPADPAGLAFFNEVTMEGADLTAIGDLASTAEYQSRFTGMSNQEIINSIYQSLFGRDGDAEGIAFFLARLEDGTYNINTIAIAILDGAQNDDLATVTAKIAAANIFTAHLDLDVEVDAYQGAFAASVGRDFLNTVNKDDPGTESEADAAIALLLQGGQNPNQPGNPGGGQPDLPATGTFSFDGDAEEGGIIVAKLASTDPNGAITSTVFQWQVAEPEGPFVNYGDQGASLSIPETQALVGYSIRVVAVTTDARGGQTTLISQPQVIANVDDEATGTVSITGKAEEGGSLSVSIEDLADDDGDASIASYQWQEFFEGEGEEEGAWINITGQTDATLEIPDDQSFVGKNVRVVITTTDAYKGTTTFTSEGQTIQNVDDEATGTVSITGKAEEGGSLSVSIEDLADDDGDASIASYQWQEFFEGEGEEEGAWINITGQTDATLEIPDDQSFVGKNVRVVITTTDAYKGTTTFTSEGQTIQNVNDLPVGPLTGALQDGEEDVGYYFHPSTLLKDFRDDDGNPLRVLNISIDHEGVELIRHDDGTYSIRRPENFNGIVELKYQVTDDIGAPVDVTRTIHFVAVNDAPVAVDDAIEVTEDLAYTFNPAANDTDVDGDDLSVVRVTGAVHGTVTLNEDGTITYTPNADYNGLDTITYVVTDGKLEATGSISVNVAPVDVNDFDSLGQPGDNVLYGTTKNGRDVNDTMYGGAGNDTIDGRGGNDTIYGGSGDDRLFGGAGNDKLFGGSGNDVLNGGADNDTLTGGRGNDTFVIGSFFDGHDTITDFAKGEDVIDLSLIDVNGVIAGRQAFTFNNNIAGNGRISYVHSVQDGDDVTVVTGISANGVASLKITLIGHIELGASDFVF